MQDTASSSLREALRDPTDEQAWEEFCGRYRPIVVGFARKLGASESDADDVAQETLSGFLVGFRRGDYDPSKGRLRQWLLGIARKKVLHLHRVNARRRVIPQDSGRSDFFGRIPDPETISRVWEEEWQSKTLRECLRRVRAQLNEQTVNAFELLTLKEWPSPKVAAHLGMSINAVLKANRRVLSRLRELQEYLEQEW